MEDAKLKVVIDNTKTRGPKKGNPNLRWTAARRAKFRKTMKEAYRRKAAGKSKIEKDIAPKSKKFGPTVVLTQQERSLISRIRSGEINNLTGDDLLLPMLALRDLRR